MKDNSNERDEMTPLSELLGPVGSREQITIAHDGKLIAKRELGFVTEGSIADSFFDALSADELGRWESI